MHTHSGCCGCFVKTDMARRSFLGALGGGALGATLSGTASAEEVAAQPALGERLALSRASTPITVQPVLVYTIFQRREGTSWRSWGGLHSEEDINAEVERIQGELDALDAQAEFPIELRPVARCRNVDEAKKLCGGDADVMLIYAANGGGGELEALISDKRNNIFFVRHKSGPVYLWYEIVHPRLLRKTVDEYGQPGLEPADVVVDEYGDVLWRLRSLYALKNTLGSKVICIGGPSGWGAGGRQAPDIARDLWKMDLIDVPLDDLGKRIDAARGDAARMQRAVADAEAWLKIPGTTLEAERGHVDRAFLLAGVFEDIMAEHKTQNITVNHCMGPIMQKCDTTACLTLTLINDSGALAFCESDFAVIPSGILLHYIAGTPGLPARPDLPAPRRRYAGALHRAA